MKFLLAFFSTYPYTRHMLKVQKQVGQTPLDVINEIRRDNPKLEGEVMSYAGRLDPMAEGEMLILIGEDENRNRQKYLGFDKEYEAEILLGFSTDTYDLLGIVKKYAETDISPAHKKKIKTILASFLKKKSQIYPEFSSKTVQGRPLFDWKKSGQIDQITLPKRKISIKKSKLIEFNNISKKDLLKYIQSSVLSVRGEFRQLEIIAEWEKKLDIIKNLNFATVRVLFKVTSGTYIRGLADELGKKLKIPACLLRLKRTQIFSK
jgi:tRNA pseudouridine55 synthase